MSVGASARVCAALAVFGLWGCGDATGPERATADVLERLRETPGELPRAPGAGTRVVMLTVGVVDHGQRVEIDGHPIPLSGTLDYERAMAEGRATVPEYWVLQTREAGENYVYWTPLDPSPEIRANLPVEGPDEGDPHALLKVPEMVVMVGLPFWPGGRVDFYRSDGPAAGRYRFGPESASPMERVER